MKKLDLILFWFLWKRSWILFWFSSKTAGNADVDLNINMCLNRFLTLSLSTCFGDASYYLTKIVSKPTGVKSLTTLTVSVTHQQHSALEIGLKRWGPRWQPTLKSWGPSYLFWPRFFTPLCKTSVDDVCERRRRERNFCYILLENRCLMPFVRKRWGPRWPPSLKSRGPIQKDGGHWPLGPRYFHRWQHCRACLWCHAIIKARGRVT